MYRSSLIVFTWPGHGMSSTKSITCGHHVQLMHVHVYKMKTQCQPYLVISIGWEIFEFLL